MYKKAIPDFADAQSGLRLAELSGDYPTWITKAVFDQINKEAKFASGGSGQLMWKEWKWTEVDNSQIYSSTFWWQF
jgi:hypothetical protein